MRSIRKEKTAISQFITLLLSFKKILISAALASFIYTVLGIFISLILKIIIDDVVFTEARFTIITLGVAVIFIIVLQAVSNGFRKLLLEFISFRFDLQIASIYIEHVLNLPIAFFESHKVGDIVSRLEDAAKVRNTLSEGILSITMDFVMILIVGSVLLVLNQSLFLLLFILVPISSVLMAIFSIFYKKKYRALMREKASVQSFVVESLSAIQSIKATVAETNIFAEYSAQQNIRTWTGWKTSKIKIYQLISSQIIKQLGNMLVFFWGSLLIMNGKITIGTLISFSTLSGYFINPIERLISVQASVQETMAAAIRVADILNEERESDCSLYKKEKISGNICFNNVGFEYQGKMPIYKALSFTIKPGSWVSFVGPSGSGKTTLVKLLMKYYSINCGSIEVDGINIDDINTKWYRSRIGYVPQDAILFSGSLRDNITMYNNQISFEKLSEIAQLTGVEEFVNKLPKRYETIIGERGHTISGGERQRIVMARALVYTPDILILDEATSNLDMLSDKKICELLKKMNNDGLTIVSIAHRLSTVIDSDVIYVLSNGEIVEIGKHDELFEKNGLYQKLWKSD